MRVTPEGYSLVQTLSFHALKTKKEDPSPLRGDLDVTLMLDEIEIDTLNLKKLPRDVNPENLSQEEIEKLLIEEGGWSREEIQFYSLSYYQSALLRRSIKGALSLPSNLQGFFLLSRPVSNPLLSSQLLYVLNANLSPIVTYWNSNALLSEVDKMWFSQLYSYLYQMLMIQFLAYLYSYSSHPPLQLYPYYPEVNPFLSYPPLREPSSTPETMPRSELRSSELRSKEPESKENPFLRHPTDERREPRDVQKREEVSRERRAQEKRAEPPKATQEAPKEKREKVPSYIRSARELLIKLDRDLAKKERDLKNGLNAMEKVFLNGAQVFEKIRNNNKLKLGSQISKALLSGADAIGRINLGHLQMARSVIKGFLSLIDRYSGDPEKAKKVLKQAQEKAKEAFENYVKGLSSGFSSAIETVKLIFNQLKENKNIRRKFLKHLLSSKGRNLYLETPLRFLATSDNLIGIVDIGVGVVDLADGTWSLTVGNYLRYREIKSLEKTKIRYTGDKNTDNLKKIAKDFAIGAKKASMALDNLAIGINVAKGLGSIGAGVATLKVRAATAGVMGASALASLAGPPGVAIAVGGISSSLAANAAVTFVNYCADQIGNAFQLAADLFSLGSLVATLLGDIAMEFVTA